MAESSIVTAKADVSKETANQAAYLIEKFGAEWKPGMRAEMLALRDALREAAEEADTIDGGVFISIRFVLI